MEPDEAAGPKQFVKGEFDNGGEDLIMMSIPREGNADQLNKSTKLTLSSKKQYDNHLQNISISQNPPSSSTNQYMLPINSSQSAQGHTQAGMMALSNINAAAMNVTRSKMNSTMMVKFNSSTDKNIANNRSTMNKSTLLPSNVSSHYSNLNNSRNPNMKINLNVHENQFYQEPNMQSLDHLNRSVNMHQLSAFSHNTSYQQSPPNLRKQANAAAKQQLSSITEGKQKPLKQHNQGLYINGMNN